MFAVGVAWVSDAAGIARVGELSGSVCTSAADPGEELCTAVVSIVFLPSSPGNGADAVLLFTIVKSFQIYSPEHGGAAIALQHWYQSQSSLFPLSLSSLDVWLEIPLSLDLGLGEAVTPLNTADALTVRVLSLPSVVPLGNPDPSTDPATACLP